DLRLLELSDHPLAIGREDGAGTVDHADAVALPLSEGGEHLLALAHEEDRAGRGGDGLAHVLRVLEVHCIPLGLEVLARQTEDLRVVVLPPGRMRPLAEDAPAVGPRRFPPPRRHALARSRASASATSSARSTSTTSGITCAYIGWPSAWSHIRSSRS